MYSKIPRSITRHQMHLFTVIFPFWSTVPWTIRLMQFGLDSPHHSPLSIIPSSLCRIVISHLELLFHPLFSSYFKNSLFNISLTINGLFLSIHSLYTLPLTLNCILKRDGICVNQLFMTGAK